MTTHEPAEKNLKHKTDVMSWPDVPWHDCDLNFRPPSLSRLSLSTGAAYGQLCIAAAVAVSLLALSHWLLPAVTGASWIKSCVVAAIISLLISSGWYRPLPWAFGKQDTSSMGLFFSLCLIGFFAIVRLSTDYPTFDVGLMVLFAAAIPSCLYFADQLTGHMLHWYSADPGVPRNTMVLWRNAWRGRFITPHHAQLHAIGVDPRVTRCLQRYWLGHAVVISIYATSIVSSLFICARLRIAEFGLISVAFSSLALLTAAAWADWRAWNSSKRMSRVWGQWFLYLKDSPQPPWVMPSPVGPQIIRVFLSFIATGLLAIAFALIGRDSPETTGLYTLRTGCLTDEMLIGAIPVLFAPLHCLLICYVVSTPILSRVELGLCPPATERGDRS